MPKPSRTATKGKGRIAKGKGNEMEVPYDEWGPEVRLKEIKKGDTIVGYIDDEDRYDQEPDIRKITKKDIMTEIGWWRNDDGTYGSGDEAIYIAYKDGTFVDAVEDLNGKAINWRNVSGISLSTGDYEMVWGGEYDKSGNFTPWQTWSLDGESGLSNSYSGYKTTATYKVRVQTTYEPYTNNRGETLYKTVKKVIRKSQRKAYE